jgi:hypothetical protein
MKEVPNQRTSMFRRRKDDDPVKPGAQFRRRRIDMTVETAEVRSVYLDPVGIPHVRYNLHIEHPSHHSFNEGTRVLALTAFTQHFPEPIAA